MAFSLKPISREAIPAAIEKVHRYRNLNEPAEAESICLDILAADPQCHEALILLLLSRTDQIDSGANPSAARELLARLPTEYERAYFAGIISERAAKALVRHSRPGSAYTAYEQLRKAMDCFERAEHLRPPDNDEALLRYNACVRMLESHPELQPRPAERLEAVTSE